MDLPADTSAPDSVRDRCREVLHAAWQDEGYCVPNPAVYPHQWLWDSAFHALVWAELGEPDRAVEELAAIFRFQSPSGFVPHMNFARADRVAGSGPAEFWRSINASTISQPPMYGHALASLAPHREPPSALIDRARTGLRHLLFDRGEIQGLPVLCHPWESGCDDSPRWDHFADAPFDPVRWRDTKAHLIHTCVRGADGSPIENPSFRVGNVGFAALVAWNAQALLSLIDDPELDVAVDNLIDALDRRWDADLHSWIDAGAHEASSGRIPTLDSLLPLLVTRRSDVWNAVLDDLQSPEVFAAPFGPRTVPARHLTYRANVYWRGPTWPQLAYLLGRAMAGAPPALEQRARPVAERLSAELAHGAGGASFSEYWDPETGVGLGARPQSWSALAVFGAMRD